MQMQMQSNYFNDRPDLFGRTIQRQQQNYLNQRPSFFDGSSQELQPRRQSNKGKTDWIDWCADCNSQSSGHADPITNLFYCTFCWKAFDEAFKEATMRDADDEKEAIREEPMDGCFYSQSLEELMENEKNANRHYGKLVKVCMTSGRIFKGILSTISTDSSITFDYVKDDSYFNCNRMNRERVVSYKCIYDILLLDENDEGDCQTSEDKNCLSITHEIFDLAKLKMVQQMLHYLCSTSADFKCFDAKHRNKYLKKSTKCDIKAEIGKNIQNLKFHGNSSIVSAFFEINCREIGTIGGFTQHGMQCGIMYDLNEALSLICHYHQLWISHIDSNKDKADDQISNSKRCHFTQWDNDNIKKSPMGPPMPPYVPNVLGDQKSKTVHIASFWPYKFFGPCTKSFKKNQNWKCMKCHQGKSPFDRSDKITYYKAKRTDVTMEICPRCVGRAQTEKTNKRSNRWRTPVMSSICPPPMKAPTMIRLSDVYPFMMGYGY